MVEVFVLGIIFLSVVAPIWIVAHYLTRWRTSKSLSQEDEAILQTLWRDADKMDSRIKNLERILDAEVPDWRERA